VGGGNKEKKVVPVPICLSDINIRSRNPTSKSGSGFESESGKL
jgi:hypothetical protein